MDATNLCHLLLNTNQLIINEIGVENDKIRLGVESNARKATCPMCKEESSEIHSSYMRYPTDFPWADLAVIFDLRVKRFFCRNKTCPKQTFAERFPDLVMPYARRTNRVLERQQRIGVNTCARIAEKLLELEQIGISDATVNRFVRKLPDPESIPVRVLGVDDWAKRKGQRYGTILVDLERRQIVDLLGDRTADTLSQWLKLHPGIEIVSRDRSQTYAEGITRGVPDAVQVADRWHLLKNLSDTVFKILQQEYAIIKNRLKQVSEQKLKTYTKVEKPKRDDPLTSAEERRKGRMICTHQLLNQGWTVNDN